MATDLTPERADLQHRQEVLEWRQALVPEHGVLATLRTFQRRHRILNRPQGEHPPARAVQRGRL
jgi:hypothetical protein